MKPRVVSYGCDPEIFLKDANGTIKSAIGLFGGSKEKPKPIRTLGPGFAVQEDNVLVEFNIPPATNAKEFVSHVQKTVDLLSKRAARHGLSFASGSAYSLNSEELQHPRAKIFGCDPDFNAYTGEKNPRPLAEDRNLRSAGGHIAVGFNIWNNPTKENLAKKPEIDRFLVKYMDFMWGIPSILLDEGEKRRQLYGKPGAYRPKPFGVEYRTLSNFWIFSPDVTEAMLDDFSCSVFNNFEDCVNFTTRAYHSSFNLVEVALETGDKDFAKWAMNTWHRGTKTHQVCKNRGVL